MSITPEIQVALDELRATFPDSLVTFEESGDGGAWVRIEPVDLGPAYTQSTSWIAFHLPYVYPESDIYPMFVRPDLARFDGQPLGDGFAQPVGCGVTGSVQGTQLSRRTAILEPETNTAVGKVLKVLRWVRTR
jgi:hypothetical protein